MRYFLDRQVFNKEDKKVGKLLLLIISLLISPTAFSKDRVLIIESYHSEHPWDVSYVKGIKEVFDDNVELHTFQMNTKKIPKDQFQIAADNAWGIYEKLKPRLVILGDDNALSYIGPMLGKTKTPVVYLGINSNPRKTGIYKYGNITGVLERPLYNRQIAIISSLIPAQKVLILFDASVTSAFAVEEAFQGKKSLDIAGVKVDLQLVERFKRWKQFVNNAKYQGYDAIVIGLFHTLKDNEGAHIPEGDVIDWTSHNTPVPIFSFWDFGVGQRKSIGGMVQFGYIQGQTAATIAKNILNGGQPNHFPPMTPKKGRLLFSKTQLDKWNIRLPDNYILHNASYVD